MTTFAGSATDGCALGRRETITIDASPAAAALQAAPGADARTLIAWLPSLGQVDQALVERAAEVVRSFRSLSLRHNRVWLNPNVAMSAQGEIVLEWWYGARKLTLYVSGGGVDFVRVWGPSVHEEMEDGALDSSDVASRLWLWLT